MSLRPNGLLITLALAAALGAQEQLRVQGPVPATVVLGSTSRIDLVVEGQDAEPDAPSVPSVPGLSIRLTGPSRQMYSSFSGGIVMKQVTTTYQLILQPQQEGKYVIPAFAWRTGAKTQSVGPFALEAVKELRGGEFGYLSVQADKQRLYVHEPLRVRVEFGVDKSLRLMQGRANNGQPYYDVEVQAPWLSSMVGAEPMPDVEEQGERAPVVLNQTLQFAAFDAEHARGAKTYQSFTFRKSFLPTRPGKFTLDAPMLRYDVLLREGRVGLFGERSGGQQQNYYVYGKPIEVEVLPIPEQGRPSPYFGAVGRFAVEATADRDRVKVGNSVKVTLAIRGSGNFEFLRVPDLDHFEALGLHKLAQSKAQKDGALLVTYDLTPLSPTVKEIPAIEWNYFDTTPGVEKFATVATKPLALVVQPLAEGESLAPLTDDVKKAVVPGVNDIFDLPELASAPVVRTVPSVASGWLGALLPWVLIAVWIGVRSFVRERNRDPLAVRARKAAAECERALASGAEPLSALAEYLGARLRVPAAAVIGQDLPQRLQAAGFADDLAAQATRAIEQGTAARYGGSGGLDAGMVRALVAAMEAHSASSPPVGAVARGLLVLCCLALAAGGLRAQSADDAVAAYRKGDYAAAESAFAARFAQTGDRRLWFARGNCYFRQQDYPRAIWAYECARLAMPRDPELLANLKLARQKLELGGEASESFAHALADLRDRLSRGELVVLTSLLMAIAAVALGLGWRKPVVRWLGLVALLPGLLLAIEVLWLAPARPAQAVALGKLDLVSEPKSGLAPVASVASGTRITLRSDGGGEWVRVDADGHSGYAPRKQIGKID